MNQTILRKILCSLIIFLSFAALHAIPNRKHIQRMELELEKMVNQERAKWKLPALNRDNTLHAIAREHSLNMSANKIDFGHGGFEKRAEIIKKRKKHSAFGENVAYCYLIEDPLTCSLDGWMNSSSHRSNILDDFNETGIGIAYNQQGYCYITQLFAKRVM